VRSRGRSLVWILGFDGVVVVDIVVVRVIRSCCREELLACVSLVELSLVLSVVRN